MKKDLSTILLVFGLLAGLALLLYPSVSNHWNSVHQSQAITSYDEQVSVLDKTRYDQLWSDACKYNNIISARSNPFLLNEKQDDAYWSLLDVGNNGIMGYIQIPAIDVSLPIYHGASESVLQVAAGHLEWSSLPVGGESTHCVLSGHRGLPGAKLFTALDQLTEGDSFVLKILDKTLTYQVDKISIVEPHETQALMIVEGEDLCTLVTCTPYGVNTHRLLVRGHRIENAKEQETVRITADAIQFDPMIIAPIVAIPLLLIFMGLLLLKKQPDDECLFEDL